MYPTAQRPPPSPFPFPADERYKTDPLIRGNAGDDSEFRRMRTTRRKTVAGYRQSVSQYLLDTDTITLVHYGHPVLVRRLADFMPFQK